MKATFVIAVLFMSLLVSACSAGNAPTAATPEVLPTVLADTAIIAEGRLEPVRAAKIAFPTGGRVSEVPVAAGQFVKEDEVLIRLGEEADTNYAAAQLELVSAQQALTELKDTGGTELAQAVIDLKEAQETYDKAVDNLDYLENSQKVPQTETRSFLVQTC